MAYVYCNQSTREIVNITRKQLSEHSKGTRVEVQVSDDHECTKNPSQYQLNKTGDGIEQCDYNFMLERENRKLWCIVETLVTTIRKFNPVFPSPDKIYESIQEKYAE